MCFKKSDLFQCGEGEGTHTHCWWERDLATVENTWKFPVKLAGLTQGPATCSSYKPQRNSSSCVPGGMHRSRQNNY